ncbi:MAG: anti-sigma factor family protein [Terriglobales bacterium]
MTTTCQQFVERSSEFLDGELDPAAAQEMSTHAAACARCQALLASLQATVRWLGDETLFAMPEGVHERLHAALATGLDEPLAPAELRPARVPLRAPSPALARAPQRHWRWSALAVAAVIILAAIGFFRTRAEAITTSGWLIDTHCLASYGAKLAEHPAACLLKCGKQNAVGVMDASGHFVRFDAHGRQSVLAEVRASHRADHLWVTARGKRSGSSQAPVLDVEQVELTRPGTTTLETR